MDFDVEMLFEQTTVPIQSDLRAYYVHPESRDHFISFEVDSICVSWADSPRRKGARSDTYSLEYRLPRMFTGDFSAVSTKAWEFFESYGLAEYGTRSDIQKYFIGVFRPTDSIAVDYFLSAFSEWDQEPTGVVQKLIGYTEYPEERKLRPYEYMVGDE